MPIQKQVFDRILSNLRRNQEVHISWEKEAVRMKNKKSKLVDAKKKIKRPEKYTREEYYQDE